MKNTMQEYLHKFQKEHKHFYRYASVVGVLALITVLVVNWQLHGTGVAMSSDDPAYVCGLEEHEHSLKEGCYEVSDADLICGHTEGEIIDAAAAAAYDAANGKSTADEKASTEGSTSGSNTNTSSNTDSNSSDNGGNNGDNSSDTSRIEELKKQITELENQEISTQKEHHHTDACYEEKMVETEPAKTEKELTCDKSEHTHSDDCYTQEEGSEEKTLTCGQDEHTHDDSCYTEKTTEAKTTTEKTLTCGHEDGDMVDMNEEEIQQAKDEKAKKLEELQKQLEEAESATASASQTVAQIEENSTPAAEDSSNNTASANNSQTVESTTTVSAENNNAASESTAATENNSASAENNSAAGSSTTSTDTENNNSAAVDTSSAENSNAGSATDTNTANTNTSTSASGTATDVSASASGSTGSSTTEASSTGDTVNDGRHHHTIECYSTYKLLCEKTEHKHTSACLIDKNADVETAADWEATIPGLSGDRAADLISVARSQLGYTESTRNYDEESHRGYTRYGEWYGNPYGDWGTFFAAFCLHYAQITDVPTNSGVQAWISNVQSADLWWDASESNCIKEGDLVFFNDGNDHMGIISSISGSAISVIEGNRPNGDGADSVQENSYDTSDGNIAGYCELPVENHDDQIKVMDSAYGADLSDYLDSVKLEKKDGVKWVETDTFLTTDSVRANLSYSELPKQNIIDNGYKCYIPLSANIDCSGSTGGKVFDDGTEAGTYSFVKGEDGNWNVVLDLNKGYIDNAGSKLHGTINFQFEWDVTIDKEEGDSVVYKIGKTEGKVTIKKAKDEGNNFNLSKEASKISIDDEGYAYVDYTVTLEVKTEKGYEGPIELTDVLTAQGFDYVDNSVKVSKEGSDNVGASVSVKNKKDTDTGKELTFEITSGSSDGRIAAGKYKITYRVKTIKKFSNDAEISSEVQNKVTVEDGDKEKTDSTKTSTSTGGVDKSGKVSTEDGNVYVDYTVTVNKGSIIANLNEETTFTDKIPDELELVEGSVHIKQYGQTGQQISDSTEYSYENNTISSTLGTGRYYYVITYRTKVKDPDSLPMDGKEITNTAKTEGGIEGEDSDKEVVKRDDLLTKTNTGQEFSKDDAGSDTVLLKWKSQINVKGSLAGYTYKDWGDSDWINNQSVAKMCMTDAQISNVKLSDKDGNVVSSDKYTIERLSYMLNNQVDTGLFQIVFSGDVQGPVTIEYETTGKLSIYSDNRSSVTYTNFCQFGTRNAQASASVELIDHNVIKKSYQSYYRPDSGNYSVTLEQGVKTLTWYVTVNDGSHPLTGDLKITDKIADGMTFVSDSLNIDLDYIGNSIKTKEGVTWSYSDGTLEISIKESVYKGNTIRISYKTQLPDDFFDNDDSTGTFSNTAEIEYNGGKGSSSFSQTVTKTMITKKGTYDQDRRELIYQIPLNTDGNKLNNGNPLKVVDELSGELLSLTKMNSLKMYSAKLVTGSDGAVSYVAGSLIQEMIEDQTEPTQPGHYYYDGNGKFTALIPDGQACVLVAQYTLDEFAGTSYKMSNKATLYGKSQWSAEDKDRELKQSSSSTIGSHKDIVTIKKRDAEQGETLLDGAEFEVKQYDADSNAWVDPSSKSEDDSALTSNSITAKNGIGTTNITRNILYRIRETKAPTGYLLDSTPKYFIAYTKGEEIPTLPESIGGDSNYNKNNVKVCPLEAISTTTEGTVATTVYGNIELDFYDQKDRTIVQKGELSVTKSWIDSNGDKISKYTDLAKLPKIKVTLTKHTPAMYKITVNGENSTQCIVEVPQGATSTVKLSGYSSSTSGNGSITYSEGKTVISNITGDISLTIDQNVSGTYAQTYVWKEVSGAESLSRIVETVISTQELSNDNDWYYLWQNLEAEDYITYTLTEETVEGYQATYQLNKSDIEAGKEFSLKTSGDFITITNCPDSKLYTLPKTGGIGVMPIYVTGGMLTAGAAGLWVTKNRRKRER